MRLTKFVPPGYTGLRQAVNRLVIVDSDEFFQSINGDEARAERAMADLRRRDDEAKRTLRRALSAGQLRAFYTGMSGRVHPVPSYFWNGKGGEAVFAGEDYLWLPEWGEDGPPTAILLLSSEFEAWRGGQQPIANGPVQACVAWLSGLMKQSPTSPPPKPQLRCEAMTKFEGLTWRAFDRAWDMAKAANPAATGWGLSGRKPAASPQ
jgi:hypothetical protein